MTDYFYHPLNGNGGTLASNGEQEWYINNNDPATSSVVPWTVKNGILTLTAQQAPASIQPLINGYQYTSGMINTHASFSQTYGFFEMRSQLPAGQGTWPAFWLLPESGAWPPEIDIMEVLGNSPTTLYTSIHSGTSSNEINGGGAETVADTSKAYHEFAVDWTPTTITWYFDNKPVYSAPTPSDMINTPMYMIANLAMGGGWPGNVDSTTPLPAQMRIADIQAYASNPNGNLATTTFDATGAAGQVYLGQPGNDIFNVGTNAVIMTGDGLTNTYVFSALPTAAAAQITDFDPGTDTIDISALLSAAGYAGSNPVSDGTITVTSDGQGGSNIVYHHNGTATVIAELDNVDPSAVLNTDFVWTNSGATSGSGSSGGTGSTGGSGTSITDPVANGTAGQVLTATAPNATFQAGQNSVVMTEAGGANTFVYTALPYNAGQITNFNPASDKIDVSAMLKAAGYTGTDPFADHTLTLSSDGHGGTELVYNPPGVGTNGHWPINVVDIDNVAAASLNPASDFVTGYTSGTSGSGTSSGGGTTGGTGSGSSGGGTTTGPTLSANNSAGQVLHASAPNATFNAGQNSAVMTEDGGANTFVYTALPYNAGQITNFNPASDKIDVTAMLHAAGYAGTNPFGDGALTLTSDGHSGTDLIYHPPGAGSNGVWPVTVVDIDNVAASSLNTATDFVTGFGGSTSTGSGTGSGTSGSSGGNTTAGPTLTASNSAGQVLHATAANATFVAGQNSVVMTEDGGANTFVYTALPYNAGQITNFNPASDKIDVSAMLHAAGYTGSNPFGDHALTLVSDGHSGTDLMYNPPGAGSNGIWSTTVVDIDNVAPGSLNTSTDFITGASASSTSSSTGSGTAAGVTLTANNTAGQVLTAATPNDTFIAGQNSVVMTGDGGANSFVFNAAPWNAGQITNFNPTSDTINVAGLLHSEGYSGTNPFGDGTLSLSSDGNGGTNLYYNPPGAGSNGHWPIKVVDIDHVTPAAINTTKDFILH
ncbi:MAG TPA: family 16 glycosylhydrolase [Rhizomicrobium sp.]|nr:family 16 glycosylhydrolase [Rhizomicrobium sp.]